MNSDKKNNNGFFVIYNQDVFNAIPEDLFDHDRQAGYNLNNVGRSKACFFKYKNLDLVLKHYFRGGLFSRLVKNTYFSLTLNRTRMWREFEMLSRMKELGLPVPKPMAARCERINALVYRGDLISEKIPASQTLAEIVSIKSLSQETWSHVGQVIARFHDNNVYHADLNAHNILLVSDGSVYLVDFDKAGINPRFRFNWARSNLNRLKRSLQKLRKNLPVFHFSDKNWRAVNEGYIRYFSTLGSNLAILVHSSEDVLPVLARLI